ncbi:MAG: hypothetical protein ACOYJG_08145 [Prevotella sp.]|jgi:hypothetical protein
MSKISFQKELADYQNKGGAMTFAFGDTHYPVVYHSMLGTLTVEVPKGNVSVVVNYNMDFDDNLDRLLDALLTRYPQLEA